MPDLTQTEQTTARNVAVVEVTADKAYSSKNNLARIAAAGATPYSGIDISRR